MAHNRPSLPTARRMLASLTPAAPNATGDDADWVNEIHPNAAGYAKLAAKFRPQLAALGVT